MINARFDDVLPELSFRNQSIDYIFSSSLVSIDS